MSKNILQDFEKWFNEPFRLMYRGKPRTNGRQLGYDLLDGAMMLFLGFALLSLAHFAIVVHPDILTNRAVCHSLVPDGFHFISADGNDSCTLSNGNQIVKAKYTFDPVELKYVLYEDK